MSDEKNVVHLPAKDAFDRFRSEQPLDQEPSNSGFSDRLNVLIENTDLDPPALGKGRAAWFAKMTGAAKPTVSEWLQNNTVPSPDMLDLIVKFLLSQSKHHLNLKRVKSWLVFGDESLNPFDNAIHDQLKPYVPLAMALISEVVKSAGVDRTSFDLQRVINDTCGMLETLNITDLSQVEAIHRTVVAQCLKLYSR